ncbi:hypothetical protein LPJ73_009128, partial [Coemansia sp. RSA 2703]
MTKRKSTSVMAAGAKKSRGKVQGKSETAKRTALAVERTSSAGVGDGEEEGSSSDEEIEEDDKAFVSENAAGLKFLRSMEASRLENVTKEAKSKAVVKRPSVRVAPPSELTSSEDDDSDVGLVAEESDSDLEINSDSDLEVNSDSEMEVDELEMASDASDASDASEEESEEESEDEEESESESEDDDVAGYEFQNSKARRAVKRKNMMEGSMGYEQQARSFGEDGRRAPKESTKLPIKTADGRLVDVESSEEEEEVSGSEQDSADEAGSADEAESGSESDDESESSDESGSEAAKGSAVKKPAAADDGDGDAMAAELSTAPDRASMTRK